MFRKLTVEFAIDISKEMLCVNFTRIDDNFFKIGMLGVNVPKWFKHQFDFTWDDVEEIRIVRVPDWTNRKIVVAQWPGPQTT